MDFTDIIYDKADRIATVTMNRPDKMNAWTGRMGIEMRHAMLDADRDDNIGAIIVTGAGRAYCAGADMGGLSEISQGRATAGAAVGASNDDLPKNAPPDYRTPYSWAMALKKPVIGAINGACVGMGFTLCLYQDIRIASDKARIGPHLYPTRPRNRARLKLDAAAHHRRDPRDGTRRHRTSHRRAGGAGYRPGRSGGAARQADGNRARSRRSYRDQMLAARRGAGEKDGVGTSLYRPRDRNQGR